MLYELSVCLWFQLIWKQHNESLIGYCNSNENQVKYLYSYSVSPPTQNMKLNMVLLGWHNRNNLSLPSPPSPRLLPEINRSNFLRNTIDNYYFYGESQLCSIDKWEIAFDHGFIGIFWGYSSFVLLWKTEE